MKNLSNFTIVPTLAFPKDALLLDDFLQSPVTVAEIQDQFDEGVPHVLIACGNVAMSAEELWGTPSLATLHIEVFNKWKSDRAKF